MNLPTITTSDIIASVALLLAAYSTWKTVKFNDRQKELFDVQAALNKRLLDKEHFELRGRQQAELGVAFLKIGSSNYRLKIFNKGKSAARRVSISFPEGNEVFMDGDVSSKFPIEVMEPHQSVELIAAVSMDSKSKHTILLRWSDDYEVDNEKLFYPTL